MGELHVGAARHEITPSAGTPLSGFIARLGASEGIADPLFVRALVAEADGRRVGIVQADLLGFPAWLVQLVREYAWQALGVPRRALLLSATHTHSGPGLLPLRGCPMAPPAYADRVFEAMRRALSEAAERLSPASITVSSVPFEMGINRRQPTATGVVLGVAPDKPRPRELDRARIRTAGQEILLFSHACHPYVLGAESRLISGDFAGQACHELEQDRLAFFLNGCAGDIAPQRAFAGLQAAWEEGARLARAATSDWPASTDDAAAAEVQGDHIFVHLPYEPLPTSAEAARIADQPERVVRPDEREAAEVQLRLAVARQQWRRAMGEVLAGERPLEPAICEVQGLALGPLQLVAIAGEPFYAIGERFRSSCRSRPWVLGTTNAYCGYLPTDEERAGGGYEVADSWQYLGLWKLAAGADERVIAAARHLLASAP